MMGLVRPDAGRIFLDGRDITNLPMYRRAILGLGYLPQETSIFRGLTVEQNIRAVLEVDEPDRQEREARLEQLLGEFGLTHLRDAPAMALSGGERRRCEIARSLAAEPTIMAGESQRCKARQPWARWKRPGPPRRPPLNGRLPPVPSGR